MNNLDPRIGKLIRNGCVVYYFWINENYHESHTLYGINEILSNPPAKPKPTRAFLPCGCRVAYWRNYGKWYFARIGGCNTRNHCYYEP